MKAGDFIMTATALIAENGEEVPAHSVGEVRQFNDQFKVAVKHKGETVLISEFEPHHIVEVW